MAADLGGFADVLLLAGLAAGFAWWYCNKPTAKAEQKTGKLISNHERTKEAIITYIVALITWLLIWQLI